MKNDINNGINCNVKNCVYNEKGCNCNLEKVTISQGKGDNHYCKSYIPFYEDNEKKSSNNNIESNEEYFDFNDLIGDISVDINKK